MFIFIKIFLLINIDTYLCNMQYSYYDTLLYFIILERFCKYDYGVNGNMHHYNMKSPPDYNLSKVTTPVYVIHSKNDHLSATKVIC